MSIAKNWCFTINNYNEDTMEKLEELATRIGNDILYIIIGKETGESGTPHLQGLIQLRSKKRLGYVKDLIGGVGHLEVMRGTATQASWYCKKENDYKEWGILVTQGMRDQIYYRLMMSE